MLALDHAAPSEVARQNVFQIHGVDTAGKVAITKQLRRGQVIGFFKTLPPCLIGMEACATAHHWARELKKLGHTVRLMPASVEFPIERSEIGERPVA